MDSLPEALSMVRETSARPRAGREDVPAKMTSSIFAERNERGPWAPSTQVTASTTLDFPLPLGPTTTVIPGSNSSTVGSAKDLNPFMLSDFRNIEATLVGPYVASGSHLPRSRPPDAPLRRPPPHLAGLRRPRA